MGNKSGDQGSRAYLLGKLLLACGEKPYILRHGTGRQEYYIVMLEVSDEEAKKAGDSAVAVSFGRQKMMPLQLEEGKKVGELDAKYYIASEKRWTSTIALMRYK